MRVGSACTGVGGLDAGLERAGMRVAWQCEADEQCRAVLKRHWPGVPCWPDLRSLHAAPDPSGRRVGAGGLRGAGCDRRASADRQQGAFGPVELFCGGTPCQGLSVAGLRAGIERDGRSVLFFDFARVASVVLGTDGWLLFENVPGLLSCNGGRDFGLVLATLADLGFHDLAWRVLDSRYFGVPQRRRRVFILARRSRGRCAAEVLLEPESGGGDHQAGGKTGSRVAGTLSHGSSAPGVSAPGRRQEDDENIVNALDTERGGVDDNSAQAGHIVGTLGSTHRGVPNAEEAAGGQIVGFVPEEAGTLRSSSGALGEDTPERYPIVSGTLRSNGRNNSNGLTEARALVSSQADPDRERAPSGLPGRLDDSLRPLTCPLDPYPDGPREAQMGNAVTESVAYWIGRRILDYEQSRMTHLAAQRDEVAA